jgi:release factor glutamine methyltransferase
LNCRQALARARKVLESSGIEDSELEGEILVRHVLKMSRAALFSQLDREFTANEKEKLDNLLERRKSGEPSAYITGYREFFNLDFKVDPRVLIPRPETELLVEKAIEACQKYRYSSVADIGTGSGCIAISLALNIPGVSIFAVDASLPALESAEENSRFHGVKERIDFLWGDLLKPLPHPIDLILANLPYVKTNEITSKREPEKALNGGADGLDKIRELVHQIPSKLNPNGMVLVEVGQGQVKTVKDSLHKALPLSVIESFQDLAGIERVVLMRLTS